LMEPFEMRYLKINLTTNIFKFEDNLQSNI